MNDEAEKLADGTALWGDFYDAPDGDYQGCAKIENIKQAILDGMRWAYADAAKTCRAEHLEDPTKEADDIAYDLAIEHAAKAIEARAK